MVFDPVHYLPLIEKKIGALDQAAPLAGWQLPAEFHTLRRLMEARQVPVRQEGDTTIVTLVEEVVVVEKRLRAAEEVRITKRRGVETSSQSVTLRRDKALIERVRAAGDDEDKAG